MDKLNITREKNNEKLRIKLKCLKLRKKQIKRAPNKGDNERNNNI